MNLLGMRCYLRIKGWGAKRARRGEPWWMLDPLGLESALRIPDAYRLQKKREASGVAA